MEELKLLIEMVANLPALAMWVLVGYLVYKLVVIGSIYGVMRLLIERVYAVLTSGKDIKYKLDNVTINEEATKELIKQVRRLKTSSPWLHLSDIDVLREALDEKFDKK